MNERKPPAIESNIHVHLRGPVEVTTASIDGGRTLYAVLSVDSAGSGLRIFPDAAALDSIIEQATWARDTINDHARRAVKYVTRLGDDSEVPARALVIGFDPEDNDYVFVRWEGEGPGSDTLAREAFDDLSPVRS